MVRAAPVHDTVPPEPSNYVNPDEVKKAIDYLSGNGPKPGSYVLMHDEVYPTLRGMMTWSINWDAVSTCASSYQYANNFERIFGVTTTVSRELAKGWSWFSLNTDNTDMSIGKVLSSLTLSEGDYIKNQTVSATY